MSDCQICFEPFDHSIRIPYSLSSCPHTFCLKCLDQFTTKNCPKCNTLIKGRNLNMALLELIPKSEYDKLKEETLIAIISINETKNDLKNVRDEKLIHHETKLTLIKNIIKDETSELINILEQNEQILLNECDRMLNELNADLDSNNYEINVFFQQMNINNIKNDIEKNYLSQDELNDINNKLFEIKKILNKLSYYVKNYVDNYKFTPNKVSNDSLLIGGLQNVNIKLLIKIYF